MRPLRASSYVTEQNIDSTVVNDSELKRKDNLPQGAYIYVKTRMRA